MFSRLMVIGVLLLSSGVSAQSYVDRSGLSPEQKLLRDVNGGVIVHTGRIRTILDAAYDVWLYRDHRYPNDTQNRSGIIVRMLRVEQRDLLDTAKQMVGIAQDKRVIQTNCSLGLSVVVQRVIQEFGKPLTEDTLTSINLLSRRLNECHKAAVENANQYRR